MPIETEKEQITRVAVCLRDVFAKIVEDEGPGGYRIALEAFAVVLGCCVTAELADPILLTFHHCRRKPAFKRVSTEVM